MSPRESSIPQHRLRVVALLAVLVAFDVAFVAAAYALTLFAIGLVPLMTFNFDPLFMTWQFDLIPLEPVLLVGVPLTLVVQSVFGYQVTLRDAMDGDMSALGGIKHRLLADRSEDESVEPDAVPAPSLEQRVARLAQTADVTVPSVTVVQSATPNSYVVSRPGNRELVVTTALLETLDDDELDAVLGHELAHLKNGDAFVMTAAAFLPTVSERFLDGLVEMLRATFIASKFLGVDREDTNTAPQAEIPMLLFALVAFPVTVALYLSSTACYRLLSRIREYAADAGGVAISGSPAAMASALETLTSDPRPSADLRTAETGVRELCVLPYAIGEDDEAVADDRLGRARARCDDLSARLLPGSHPDPEERIAAMRERQAELEQ